jgi:hypothetical protein
LIGDGTAPDSLTSGKLIEDPCGAEVLWPAGAVTSPALFVKNITALLTDQAEDCQKKRGSHVNIT